MSTEFLRNGIWGYITKAVEGSQRACLAAVAYFGAGASSLLPLPAKSRLVVDASDGAVGSGQTCPADLLKLQKRDVILYSVPNLHAKVFVIGNTAYVGSTNVSKRSANQLVEATLRTTEPEAVQAARDFVQQHCLHELTPEVLKRLAKLYRPPRIPGVKKKKRQARVSSDRPTLPRLLLAQLEREEWSDHDQAFHDEGLEMAKKDRKHPRTFKLESFRMTGKSMYRRGDVVIQITDEGDGKVLVSPPGNVLRTRTRRDGAKRVSFVYLEHRPRPRRQREQMARALGYGALKRLKRDGLVTKAQFAAKLLNYWAR